MFESDLAKYPFLPEAKRFVEKLNIDLNELSSIEFIPINERAKERIISALSGVSDSGHTRKDEIEIPSFPRAIMLLSYVNDERAKQRFALFEAKKAYIHLRSENTDKIFQISKSMFNWDIILVNQQLEQPFTLYFSDYLKAAIKIKESRRRLINRRLEKGYLPVSKVEVARLLQEEIMQLILSKFKSALNIKESDKAEVDYLKRIINSKLKQISLDSMPKQIVMEAMPPCIKQLHEELKTGRNLSHMGRFTLTSFLLNVGTTLNEIVEYFKTSADFNEEKSRYQIEHIEGLHGVRKRYIPPKCATLKTHGICNDPDELCTVIRHPLRYYQRRVKTSFAKKGN